MDKKLEEIIGELDRVIAEVSKQYPFEFTIVGFGTDIRVVCVVRETRQIIP